MLMEADQSARVATILIEFIYCHSFRLVLGHVTTSDDNIYCAYENFGIYLTHRC